MRKVKEHEGKKKLDDWRLCKIIGTEKFNDTTILIDNKLPEDITLKNVILIRCVKKMTIHFPNIFRSIRVGSRFL